METVDMLRKRLVSQEKTILRYIWEYTASEPDMVDVYNLLAKLKRQEDAGATLSNRVSKTLDRFCEKDRFAAAHVDIDREEGKHVARCITIQTSHMRSLFSIFMEGVFL
ncbi:hypothetical protein PC128_g20589 [Phytophthora cactorum]|nr:hypothetical protein PC128_g20589 [Phytophthora cactorum]